MFYRSGDATLGRQHDYKCCCPPRFVIRFWNLLSMQTICHCCTPLQLTLANICKVILRKVVPSMKVEPSVFFTSRQVPLSTLITKCTKSTQSTQTVKTFLDSSSFSWTGALHHWHQWTDGRTGNNNQLCFYFLMSFGHWEFANGWHLWWSPNPH